MQTSDLRPASDTEPGGQGAPMTSDPPPSGGAASGSSRPGQGHSPDGPEPVTRPAASGSGVSLVQPGWHVVTSDGEVIGRVARVDAERLIVARDGVSTPDELQIPREHIEAEDEGTMRVHLSTDSAAADRFESDGP